MAWNNLGDNQMVSWDNLSGSGINMLNGGGYPSSAKCMTRAEAMQKLRIVPIPDDNKLVKKSELVALANFKVNVQVQILGSTLEVVNVTPPSACMIFYPQGEENGGSNLKLWRPSATVSQGMPVVSDILELEDKNYSRLGTNFNPIDNSVNVEEVNYKLYLNGTLLENVISSVNSGSDYNFNIPIRRYTTDDVFLLTIERASANKNLLNKNYNYNYLSTGSGNLCAILHNRNRPLYLNENTIPVVGDLIEYANGEMVDNGYYFFNNMNDQQMWVRVTNGAFGLRLISELGYC